MIHPASAEPTSSTVVTGGGRGIGRAIVERLLDDGGAVAVLELDPGALSWTQEHPAAGRIAAVVGSAADPAAAQRAAAAAETMAPLTGWVNNAAVFRDAGLLTATPGEVLDLVTANLAPAVIGCAVAVRHWRSHGRSGAIVNVSSHQGQRPVRGALPYATAKAAVEGLTRAVAVDHGADGVRCNAVALGSIRTERWDALLASQPAEESERTQQQAAQLHPLGRVGEAREVADVVVHLLSGAASYVTGAVVPVDGGRSVRGPDPEEV